MARKIFISYQHEDQMKAKGFNLLRWNKNVEVEFVGRHLLDPVDSQNEQYIRSKICEQLHGTSVTVVLIGKQTYDSDWVQYEIQRSLEKDNPNGVLAIRLDEDAPLPADSTVGKTLKEAGAEVIGWDPDKFGDAIERAALAAGRAKAIKTAVGIGSAGNCGR
jgi:hypothetical protein